MKFSAVASSAPDLIKDIEGEIEERSLGMEGVGASYPNVERYHVQMLTDPTVCTFKLSITCDSHDLTRVTGALLAIFRYQLILDIPKEESRCSFGVIRIIFGEDGQVRRVIVKFFVVGSCLFIGTCQRFVCCKTYGSEF